MSNLKLKPLEVYQWLCENKLLTGDNSRILNDQFFALVHEDKRFELSAPVTSPVLHSASPGLPGSPQQWELKFINLISEAQVPARLEDGNGGEYYANKFSEPALKVFQKALRSGIIYEVLVKSVMLYYKSSVKYKKTIGNYFIQGDWRTDYLALLSAAEEGKESIDSYVKNEIKDEQPSQYKIG
jgi:hypothetical protein